MNLRKKFVTLMLSLGLVAGMGTAAFAADNAAVNLLPYPDKGEFNKVVTLICPPVSGSRVSARAVRLKMAGREIGRASCRERV